MSAPLQLQKPFKIVAAVCHNYGLGKDGGMPWKCQGDMQHFRRLTSATSSTSDTLNAVIMGYNTWKSVGLLSGRVNIVITRRHHSAPEFSTPTGIGPFAFSSLLEATTYLSDRGDIESQFIIGGGELYRQAILANWASELWLTHIPEDHECDVTFPRIPDYYTETDKFSLDATGTVNVHVYRNLYGRHYESQYLKEMRHLLGQPKITSRNGNVYAGFQWPFRIDLADGLPLFSTRGAFWRGICEELLFFIAGKTNSKVLEDKGINIWKANTTRQFLDSRGLSHYEEGDMGPMYGWNWRHYGARYLDMRHDYSGQGIDQLRDVVHKLIHDPNDRRIMMTAFSPDKVAESVLAPCHSIVNHFYVRQEGGVRYLDMYTYQRSADMFLGVYFNIPSDATLLTIVARAVGMTPGVMHVEFGNCHIYEAHVPAVVRQLERTPTDRLPTLEILRHPDAHGDTDRALAWIESLQYSDFKVHNYKPQERISADMVA
jgi:dihydrofolate reductase/thymidylate synthase